MAGKGDQNNGFDDIWFKPGEKKPFEKENMSNSDFFDDSRRSFLVIGSIVAVFLFVGLLWFLYYQKNVAGPDEVPLVTADDTPVKTRPLDPGGMEVPDQDKTVYDLVSGEESNLEEQVQAAPEQPIGDTGDKSIEDLIRETDPATDAKTTPPVETAAATPAQGLYIIQLGAFGEEDGANRAWKILKDRYKTVIGSLTPDIQRATLSEGRVLYRLRAGYFASRDQAEDICRRLKELGQDCLASDR